MRTIDRSDVLSLQALEGMCIEERDYDFRYSEIGSAESESHVYEIQMWSDTNRLPKIRVLRFGAFKDGIICYIPRKISHEEYEKLIRLLCAGLSPYEALEFIEL